MIDLEHYTEEGEPIKCKYCGGFEFHDETISIDGGHVSEYEVVCNGCEQRVGYWAYGSYDPTYAGGEFEQFPGFDNMPNTLLGKPIKLVDMPEQEIKLTIRSFSRTFIVNKRYVRLGLLHVEESDDLKTWSHCKPKEG